VSVRRDGGRKGINIPGVDPFQPRRGLEFQAAEAVEAREDAAALAGGEAGGDGTPRPEARSSQARRTDGNGSGSPDAAQADRRSATAASRWAKRVSRPTDGAADRRARVG
jgi:hypothetical protein